MTKLWHPGVLQEEKALMKEPDWESLYELKKEEEKEGEKDAKR